MRTRIINDGNRYSLICGIAIRYGEDVFVLDGCKANLKMDFPNRLPLNPAMKVIQKTPGNFLVSF